MNVPTEVKKRRNNELLAVQDEVGLAHHRGLIGSLQEVLVEGPSPKSAKRNREAPIDGKIQLVGRPGRSTSSSSTHRPSFAAGYVNVRNIRRDLADHFRRDRSGSRRLTARPP